MPNQTIRESLRQAGIRHWQLADFLKIHPSSLSIELRHELPPDKQETILAAIRAVAGEAVDAT